MSAEMYERNRFLNPAKNLSGVIYVSRFSREKHRQYMPLLSSIPSTVLYNFANEPSVDLLNHFPVIIIYFMDDFLLKRA